MFNASYPDELGLVQSLARRGGNVTGTSFRSPQVLEKLLQMLREIAPKAVRIALPWDGPGARANGGGKISAEAYERAAARLGMKIQYFDAVRGDEVEGLIERIAASPVDALVLHGAAVFRPYFAQLIAAANARGIAVAGAVDTIAQRGGLLDYSPDDLNYYDRTASYVDRILKGAIPADLPVEEPTKINLHVNLKTAKAIGLKVPQSILARADWVIE